MNEMFFVLLTMIALEAKPATETAPEVRVGDIVESTLLGAADTHENCMKGGDLLATPIRKAGGNAVLVHISCPRLPVEAGRAQGFSDIADVPVRK